MALAIYYDFDHSVYDNSKTDIATKKTHLNTIHPLILELLKKNNHLKEYLLNNDVNEQYFLNENKDRVITQIALFNKKNLFKILFVHDVRFSYSNHKHVPVLYEITFSNNSQQFSGPAEIFAYQKNAETQQLEVIPISKLNPKMKWSGSFFSGLKDTPLEIRLKLINLSSHSFIQIEDRRKSILLTFASSVIIQDPFNRLSAFFEILTHPSITATLQTFILKQTHELMNQILRNESNRKKAIELYASNPKAIQALLIYMSALDWEDGGLIPCFIEEMILNKPILDLGVRTKISQCEGLDPCTLGFHLIHIDADLQEKESLLIVRKIKMKETILEEVKKTLNCLDSWKKHFPGLQNNRIEFILPSKDLALKEIVLEGISSVNAAMDLKEITITLPFLSFVDSYTYHVQEDDIVQDLSLSHLHPALGEFLELGRWNHFNLRALTVQKHLFNYLYYAKSNIAEHQDDRLAGISLIHCSEIHYSPLGCHLKALPLKSNMKELLTSIQAYLKEKPQEMIPQFNRLFFQILPVLNATKDEIILFFKKVIEEFGSEIQQAFLEKIQFKIRTINIKNDKNYETYLIEFKHLFGTHFKIISKLLKTNTPESINPITADEYLEKRVKTSGGIWPSRIPALLSAIADKFSFEFGLSSPMDVLTETFFELDIDPEQVFINPLTGEIDYNQGELIPVSRPLGQHKAGVIIGLWTVNLHADVSMTILLIIGDLAAGRFGGITSQECARINAAIRYASLHRLPIDWFSSSHGVAIKHDKGVENLDASSATAREIVNHCHYNGLQINLVIDETNIGAQSYWNALASILLDTTGILIMTPRGSMALTGPSAIVSAFYSKMHSLDIPQVAKEFYPEGLQSLAGYDLIHGPNGDAMAFAGSLEEACELLIRHHYYTYKGADEPIVSKRPLPKSAVINKIGQSAMQRELKKLLKGLKCNREIILEALKDPNSPPPIRFWADAKGIRGQPLKRGDLNQEPTTIVQEMFIGALPTMVIFTPTGAMTPADADIIARAIFKANKRMPVLIIGSLSGFSADPLSMENRQLRSGACIIKAIVEHEGPILVVNLSKLVGGTFVIFSKQLNPFLRILALEGSTVQVIGGKSAAKVVFRSKIYSQVAENPKLIKIAALLESCTSPLQKLELKNAYKKIHRHLIAELEAKEGELFDLIHNVERALKVGSIDEIIPMEDLLASIQQNLSDLVKKYKGQGTKGT